MPINVPPRMLPVVKAGDQHEAQQHQDRLRIGEVAERDQCGWMVDHHLGFFQRDDPQKKSNTRRHGKLQVLRNCIDDVLPYRGIPK